MFNMCEVFPPPTNSHCLSLILLRLGGIKGIRISKNSKIKALLKVLLGEWDLSFK